VATLSDIPGDGPWFLAEGELQGEPMMIRARQDLLALAATESLPIRVVIEWTCDAPLSHGLPSESDYARISAFEQVVVSFLGEGAVLAFVITHSGSVTYSFYTSDTDWFIERLNDAMSDQAVAPISISADDDAGWSEYRNLLKTCGIEEPGVA
jgi:hypothetical protein